MENSSFEQRLRQLEDRVSIKSVVDAFSIFADQKDIASQLELFTEDATVEVYFEGDLYGRFKGREMIAEGFGPYLANFQKVYHINGQQTVNVDGDQATATSYCFVVLIRIENEERLRTDGGVYYHDEFIRRSGDWLIAKRVAHFLFNELTAPTF